MIKRCDVEDGGGWVGPKNGTSEAERGDDDVEAQRSKGGIVSYRIGGTLCSPGSGEAGAKGILKGRQGKGKVQTGSGRSTKGRAQWHRQLASTLRSLSLRLTMARATSSDEERRVKGRDGSGDGQVVGGWVDRMVQSRVGPARDLISRVRRASLCQSVLWVVRWRYGLRASDKSYAQAFERYGDIKVPAVPAVPVPAEWCNGNAALGKGKRTGSPTENKGKCFGLS